MEEIKENSFVFYKAAFFLTENGKLKWVFEKGNTLSSQITNEFKISITYHNNIGGPDVIDFKCTYRYFDKAHQNNFEELFERFRENNNGLYQLLNCKYFYEIAYKQAEKGVLNNVEINPISLMNEFNSVLILKRLNSENQLKPFDEILLTKLLSIAKFDKDF